MKSGRIRGLGRVVGGLLCRGSKLTGRRLDQEPKMIAAGQTYFEVVELVRVSPAPLYRALPAA